MSASTGANMYSAQNPPEKSSPHVVETDRKTALQPIACLLYTSMVIGVSKGYEIKQELVGVGFKAEVKGNILEMSLGYSHDTYLMLPPEVTATAVTEKKGNPIVTLKSIDKQLVGQVLSLIHIFRAMSRRVLYRRQS